MKRIWLMLAALAFFLVAPALAQDGDAGSDSGAGAAESAESGSAAEGENGDDEAIGEGAIPGDDAADESDDASDDGVEAEGEAGDDEAIGEDAIPGDDAADDEAEGEAGDDEVIGDDAIPDVEQVTGGDAAEAANMQPWTFHAMDRDGDGFLTEAELGAGLFTLALPEGAEGLAQEDYEMLVDRFGLDSQEVSFEMADADNDNVLTDSAEFAPSFGSALVGQWDADGDARLSANEYTTNMFAVIDANADGTVDSSEFEAVANWFDTGFEEVAGGGGGGFTEDSLLGDDTVPGEGGAQEQNVDAEGNEAAEGAVGDEGAADEADDAGAQEGDAAAAEDDAGDDEETTPAEPDDGE